MSLYLLKPIVWNTAGYVRPSGAKFYSGYPKENGFGHEEWNAASHLEFEEDGTKWRCFHTERVSDESLAANAGDIVVFLVASSNGNQFVVGVAGNATNLVDFPALRRRLTKRLGIASVERADEAWSLEQVKRCYGNDRAAFLEKWKQEADWGPTWRCPADAFLWLDKPVKLNPMAITGKSRLVTMYSTYQPIQRSQADQILMEIARVGYRHPVLQGLDSASSTDSAEADEDIDEIRNRANGTTSPTTKLALIQARRGQGRFRADLWAKWQGCAVTACTHETVLRASHIKPWRRATDSERLDPENGLLLVANLDALFDRGKISFDDAGVMLYGPTISDNHRQQLSLSAHTVLRGEISTATKNYLSDHRRAFGYV